MLEVVTIISVSKSGTYSALQRKRVRLSVMSNEKDAILNFVEAGDFYADE
jgi:hypothetical protein